VVVVMWEELYTVVRMSPATVTRGAPLNSYHFRNFLPYVHNARTLTLDSGLPF
jgi:hypothetical protein